jgi:hypothetical protein
MDLNGFDTERILIWESPNNKTNISIRKMQQVKNE